MKKAFILLSLTTLFGIGAFSFNQEMTDVHANEVSLSGSGDTFTLLDNHYDVDQSFVYTADINFIDGQAGGLVFGAAENEHYFVINMDRYENRTKLLYFETKPEGGYKVDELYVDYFIGNDKMTHGEHQMVDTRVRSKLTSVNIKIILTAENDNTFVEFYIEGIKRFGIDTVINLQNITNKDYKYEGGYLGFNCFNSRITASDIEIGQSDYSYMSEQYRNQYHLSPFANWTNDPNALVYYNGYYHCYYQTNPYGQYWDEMYWGHARSTDLIHWEFLPICLFPEQESEFGPGDAFMWSGCAVAYYKGMSDKVDSYNWFPNGNGSGLFAIFTRDGGLQDQVIMSSDDDGLTWTKRIRVPQALSGIGDRKIDYRDPKIFPLVQEGDKVTMWGMTLSSYALNRGFFLRSPNLIDWYSAGDFALPTPECIGVGTIYDEDGNAYNYLTNKSRTYMLGHISYDEMSGKIIFKDLNNVDISTYSLEQMPLKPLDLGPDTYASQSFYITDPSSKYYGKDLVLNWFSGDLNASFCTGPGEYANVRDGWNGGFTMPVAYSVKYISGQPVIAQTPITVDNTDLDKEEIINVANESIINNSSNLLENVHTNTFELKASVRTVNNSPIIFKVNMSSNEYMEFGWNETDGYYVDRSNLDAKGINTNIDYHKKYISNVLGDSDTKTFYVLSDNGGLEVFCEDFKLSFYFVTIPSQFSNNASLEANNAVVESLIVNEIKTIWRDNIAPGEGILRLSTDLVELDTSFLTSKYVTAYYTGNDEITAEFISGNDVISFELDKYTLRLNALKEGEAFIKVIAGNKEEILNVVVYSGTFNSDFTFSQDKIKSGSWVMSSDKIIGENPNGNAFLLANESGSDFTYSAKFDITSGVAGSLVFRSDLNMQHYLVMNYDSNERVVKLWNEKGEIARSGQVNVSKENVVLTVNAKGRQIEGTINGNKVLSHTLSEDLPLSGYFGLNVFSAKVAFKSLSLLKENYEYNGDGLTIGLDVIQNVNAIYNVTNKNTLIEDGFYKVENGVITFSNDYFTTLKETGMYQFRIVGELSTFIVNVDVKVIPSLTFEDLTIEEGYDLTIFVGGLDITSVKVNDAILEENDYQVNGTRLVISKDKLKVGENVITLNDEITFKVTVNKVSNTITNTTTTNGCGGSIIGSSLIVSICSLVGVFGLVFSKKKEGKK